MATDKSKPEPQDGDKAEPGEAAKPTPIQRRFEQGATFAGRAGKEAPVSAQVTTTPNSTFAARAKQVKGGESKAVQASENK
jgi:hypothetical protein